MLTLALIWIVVGVALALASQRSSAGLPLAYFAGLSIIHAPGAMIHLDAEESKWTRLGFELTVIGMVAFLVGVIIGRTIVFLRRPEQNTGARRLPDLSPGSLAALNRLALYYCLFGGIDYFILMPLVGEITSATAITSSIGALIVVGACLRLWVAQEGRDWLKWWTTICLVPLLPLSTVIYAGFLGYGTYWALTISTFIFAQSRQRLLYFSLAPVVVYVGMSVFVNYMDARQDLRKLVWYQQSSLADRLDRVENIFQNFEWLDLSNKKHRESIDGRLNQNFLVGAAVERLKSGRTPFASGATISDMMISLIPRAIWPDKPPVGGGGNVVTKFTGIRFARGTSVGAGQVLEFYVNFGTWGVIGGFIIYGLLLGYMDVTIIESLRRDDRRRYLFWFMIALSLLQPGGNLIEITVSAAAAVPTAYVLNVFFNQRRSPSDLLSVPSLPRKKAV
jgi:hypothetical protein